jgi:hypothetical protein
MTRAIPTQRYQREAEPGEVGGPRREAKRFVKQKVTKRRRAVLLLSSFLRIFHSSSTLLFLALD